MKSAFILCFLFGFSQFLLSQRDSISIVAKLSDDQSKLFVEQEITYHNRKAYPIEEIKLLNWINAYQSRHTNLLTRKVEDRKKDLYFANPNQLGACQDLQFSLDEHYSHKASDNENLFFALDQPLDQGKSIKLKLRYTLLLPDARFTGYGRTTNEIILKYFFLVPDTYEDDKLSPTYYKDIEETASARNYWDISFLLSDKWQTYSNLNKINKHTLKGISVNDPEIILSTEQYPSFNFDIDKQNVLIQLAYPLDDNEKQILEFYLPLQLQFIKKYLGRIPEKLLITEKFSKKESFIGTEDIRFLHFRYPLFEENEKTDLNYFSILSQKIVDESFVNNKNKEHWLKNGIKTYLEIQYLDRFYPNKKLLADLPDNAKFLGIKPLNIFFASKLKLRERYGLAYHYIATQNLDQSIGTPYDALSNYNTSAISHFEMGNLLDYIAQSMPEKEFDNFLKQYIENHYQQITSGQDFLDQLEQYSQHNSDFLHDMMQEKHRINLSIKRVDKTKDSLEAKIANNTSLKLPLKLETEDKAELKNSHWQTIQEGEQSYLLPREATYKIILNDYYSFPETNYRDNYIYTKGLYTNSKKIKLKLLKDVANPEFNEIFITPRLGVNAYDKVLLGASFRNSGFFDRRFNYSVSPYYSTGTNSLTGSASTSYSIMPANSWIRSLTLGVSGTYYHYNYGLAYRRLGASTVLNLQKNPRSAVGNSFYMSYNYYNRDLSPAMVLANDYAQYRLWSFGYNYSDNSLINEKYLSTNYQWMRDYQKLSLEALYRWEYAKDKKISFRWFAGYFVKNDTKTNLFNYGVSRVSNYSFAYGLLGQSAVSGILSQQFILAEGGFKSAFNRSVNQFISSVNIDAHAWKMINLYADAGIYKNKNQSSQVIWDSGIKVKVIPDFLEIFFPIASSLGFEPGFKDYGSRIRYTLNLNLSAIVGHLRRGVY